MHIILFIIGGLLALFGGGCLFMVGAFLVNDPSFFSHDVGFAVGIVLVLGVLPIVAGLLIIRWGRRVDKRRRQDQGALGE